MINMQAAEEMRVNSFLTSPFSSQESLLLVINSCIYLGLLFQCDDGKGWAMPFAHLLSPPQSTKGPISFRNIQALCSISVRTVGSLQSPCIRRTMRELSVKELDWKHWFMPQLWALTMICQGMQASEQLPFLVCFKDVKKVTKMWLYCLIE